MGAFGQPLYGGRAVEQRVVGMDVEMDEVGCLRHGSTVSGSARDFHVKADGAERARVWRAATAGLAILRRLNRTERARLRALAGRFLAGKRFEAARGAALDPVLRARVAAQACLPILELGLDWYADWSTVVIVPERFTADFEEVDEAGVVHEWVGEASGESWDEGGPIVLSRADIDLSGAGDGFNVVIHEVAHKLDALDGGLNGRPPLHAGMDARGWARAFTEAYTALCEAPDDFALDPYAAEAPEEFFAVASEHFFELPETLAGEHPAVYAQLAAFYRRDPRSARGRRP